MSPKELAEALEAAFQHARDMDASLSERLEFIADAVRSLSAPFAEAADRLVIEATPDEDIARQIAEDPDTAPEVTLDMLIAPANLAPAPEHDTGAVRAGTWHPGRHPS